MNATTIVEKLKNIKGQNVKACWSRQVATPKDCPLSVTKTTCAYVRAGINYSNLAKVKDGIESGERSEVKPLPWGVWTNFPFVIEHKGQEYVRLYPCSFSNLPMDVSYTIDGKPATPDEAYIVAKKGEVKVSQVSLATFLAAGKGKLTESDYIAQKEKDSLDKPECFTLKSDSLVSIG